MPWLNQFTDKTESKGTREWNRSVSALKEGTKDIAGIREHFKVSKANATELERQAKL